jgi:hypothetical protein
VLIAATHPTPCIDLRADSADYGLFSAKKVYSFHYQAVIALLRTTRIFIARWLGNKKLKMDMRPEITKKLVEAPFGVLSDD